MYSNAMPVSIVMCAQSFWKSSPSCKNIVFILKCALPLKSSKVSLKVNASVFLDTVTRLILSFSIDFTFGVLSMLASLSITLSFFCLSAERKKLFMRFPKKRAINMPTPVAAKTP